MSAVGCLRAALGDMYRHSWRLLLCNAALSAAVLPFLFAALWAPLALVPATLVAGVFAAALMHCAVELAQKDELGLRCFAAGLALHWRRGLALGASAGLVFFAGGVALDSYRNGGAWVLVAAAVVLYVLAACAAFQVALWPLAVAERSTPLRAVLAAAAAVTLRHPIQLLLLALLLALINLAGAAAALMPFLTLTLAYSALAAAHFTLPRNPLQEDSGRWPR